MSIMQINILGQAKQKHFLVINIAIFCKFYIITIPANCDKNVYIILTRFMIFSFFLNSTRLPAAVPHWIGLFLFCIEFGWG